MGCRGPQQLEAVRRAVLTRFVSRQFGDSGDAFHEEVGRLSAVVRARPQQSPSRANQGAFLCEFPFGSLPGRFAGFDAASGKDGVVVTRAIRPHGFGAEAAHDAVRGVLASQIPPDGQDSVSTSYDGDGAGGSGAALEIVTRQDDSQCTDEACWAPPDR